MPPVPTTYTNPTGKRALFASINNWLKVNVPPLNAADFTYGFLQQINPAVMPRVDVNEFRYFDPGESAYGGVIFPAATAPQQGQGKANLTMLELNIFTDQNAQADAKQKMYTIRDRLVYGLVNSGVPNNTTGVLLVPEIKVLDPANSDFDTGTVARLMTEEDNFLIENYFPPTAEKPSIHQYQLLAKIGWYEMRA